MSYYEHKKLGVKNIGCAVLTTSDNRTEETDESGKLIKQRLVDSSNKVACYAILKNDAQSIKNKILELLKQNTVQVIITSGGTGVSHKDVTVDTIQPMLEKKLDGFGELFRSLTYQELGTASIMSRAIAGVINGKVIICIPGSLEAAQLAMDKIILPEIGHLLREATR
ncbi:MAG: MogA/MoaB family molybdenum cofactor biosynthesis protein [Dehalococcoidales bacterium]|nr:MogA/MoaB family molybdenum cofactor biosynthesis protein [Dehalococcoidales bacterium]